jgi:membrane protein DedA with SNARE-associated domain
MAWVGIAMYGAYAIGAPLGELVHQQFGFVGIAILAMVLPSLALRACIAKRRSASSAA